MLENIHIASPCNADWEKMQGDDRVRHCVECNLNVYNFSEMTADEVNALIMQREGRLCARLYRRPDGTLLTRDCPVGLWRRVRRISSVVSAALWAAVLIPFASAQDSKQNSSQQLVQIETGSGGIAAKISDLSGAPYASAKLQLQDQDGKVIAQGISDKRGIWRLSNIAPGSYMLLAFAPGTESKKIPIIIKSKEITSPAITLEPAALMGDVVEVPQPSK